MRSEIPCGMCTKLRTVAASNNRVHARKLSSHMVAIVFSRSYVNIGKAATLQSLLLLLARATHVMVLFFTHIPFVVNHTMNATPLERLQQCKSSAIGGGQNVWFLANNAILFGKTLLKTQNDHVFQKFGGGHGPFAPPWLRLWLSVKTMCASYLTYTPITLTCITYIGTYILACLSHLT